MEIPHHTLGLNVSFARGVAVCDAATFLVTSEVLAGLTKYPQYFRLNPTSAIRGLKDCKPFILQGRPGVGLHHNHEKNQALCCRS
jgi:hypothetical protein